MSAWRQGTATASKVTEPILEGTDSLLADPGVPFTVAGTASDPDDEVTDLRLLILGNTPSGGQVELHDDAPSADGTFAVELRLNEPGTHEVGIFLEDPSGLEDSAMLLVTVQTPWSDQL